MTSRQRLREQLGQPSHEADRTQWRARCCVPRCAAGQSASAATLRTVATDAFIHSLSVGCYVAGGVAIAGALLAVLFLPAQPLVLEASQPKADLNQTDALRAVASSLLRLRLLLI